MLLPPVVIIYILVVAPLLARSDATVVSAFRPLVLVDDDTFNRLVQGASSIPPLGEGIAFALGALLGLWLGWPWGTTFHTPWLKVYAPLFLGLMLGLLGWTIYCSIVGTRLTAELHRQPLQVDILDLKPFHPVGRQSLAASLVFVGGILLGALLGLDVENIYAWQTWLFYLPLASVPVIVFFLNMRHTHRVLAAEKKRELATVQHRMELARQSMRQCIAHHDPLDATAAEFGALVAYEARVRAARTWPYNTSMLRTLFFTILIPLLVRGLSALLFSQ